MAYRYDFRERAVMNYRLPAMRGKGVNMRAMLGDMLGCRHFDGPTNFLTLVLRYATFYCRAPRSAPLSAGGRLPRQPSDKRSPRSVNAPAIITGVTLVKVVMMPR